jgi:hypothetical protein
MTASSLAPRAARRAGRAVKQLRAGVWLATELRRVRRELREHGTSAIARTPPRDLGWSPHPLVLRVAGYGRATCLERSLIRQAWLRGRGDRRDVVIGVRRANDPEAHAWLEGDPDSASYVEIHRIAAGR